MQHWISPGLAGILIFLLTGCASMQYAALEKVGVQKRDILVDRIEETQSAQEQIKQRFNSAYELFASLVDVDVAELESAYKKLSSAVERSEKSTEALSSRIAKVESVAEDLFDEWQRELDLYSNQNLRAASEKNLNQTRRQYKNLMARMYRAEDSVQPVLFKLQDNVLYLKHNLNARAVNALDNEVDVVQIEVRRLIEEMEAAISESDTFLQSMQSG